MTKLLIRGTPFVMGLSARIVQFASTLAGTAGPVAARGEGSASAVLTASRQVGSALGVAVVSATLVTVQGAQVTAQPWLCLSQPLLPSQACSPRGSFRRDGGRRPGFQVRNG